MSGTKDDVKTGGFAVFAGEVQGKPVYCLSGIRHKAGASLIRTFVRNLGTSCFGVKGAIQVEKIHKNLSTKTKRWGRRSRRCVEAFVMEAARRGSI